MKDYSNDPLASGDPYAYDASDPDDDYGQEKAQPVTSTGGFGSYNDYGSGFQHGVGIYKPAMKATTSPASLGDGSVYRVNNYLQTDRARMDTAGMAAQNGTGIFSNAFADRWTMNMVDPEPEEGWVHTPIIDHIIKICDFSHDSTIVKYMVQQQWTDLDHVVMVDLDEVKDFHTVREDGLTFEAKPMLTHCRQSRHSCYFISATFCGLMSHLQKKR